MAHRFNSSHAGGRCYTCTALDAEGDHGARPNDPIEFEPGETYGGVKIDDDGNLINPWENDEEND